jgi:HD-GYP domain-containing protein (c-di-GMP phosphodiesterase class II)
MRPAARRRQDRDPGQHPAQARPLSPDEYEQVKRHAELGAAIAAEVLEDEQVTWIRGHHERWDGRGYPDELDQDTIPDGAQLLAIADAWDVMTADRCYESAKSVDVALAECSAQAGRQFAPTAVAALLELAVDGALQTDGRGPAASLETSEST